MKMPILLIHFLKCRKSDLIERFRYNSKLPYAVQSSNDLRPKEIIAKSRIKAALAIIIGKQSINPHQIITRRVIIVLG